MEMSQNIQKYFKEIDNKVKSAYNLAQTSKLKGIDPSEKVEIMLAKNMAERIEGLISFAAPQIIGKGMPNRIFELENEYGKLDWRVGLSIALEVTQEKFCNFKDKEEAMNTGIRVGLAYITLGVVSSPLEGFLGIEIKKRRDGKEYFALRFGGPIRSAGGTGASVGVLIADYIRKKMGYEKYDPTDQEIKRAFTEVRDFHERVTNLQYYPSEEEIEFLVSHLPVQIDGDPSEKYEVSNYKDLDRIGTNILRNGFCLVMAECLAQKAPKLFKQVDKWGKDFELDDWNFLEKFVSLQKRIKAKGDDKSKSKSDDKIKPDHTFIKDLVAGRPVLTYPMRPGGFRLRYGRCRNTGLSSTAIHPITMKVLNDFIAIGTQLKMERPGKGTVVSSCDSIEGPVVKLKNGNVLFLDKDNYEKNKEDIDEILFLGDILIPYGDFFNRAHILVSPGYCEEWWFGELKKKCKSPEDLSNLTNIEIPLIKKLFQDPLKNIISAQEAYKISKKLNIPLHPKYTFHWKALNEIKFLSLLDWLNKAVVKKDEYYKIILPLTYESKDKNIELKRILEEIGIPHNVVSKEHVTIEGDSAIGFMITLGFYKNELELSKIVSTVKEGKDILKVINKFSELEIKDKSGLFIGARMGRPEKAKMRKLTGSPHGLFPVGIEGGRLRSFQSALDYGSITADFPIYYCESCKDKTVYTKCHKCRKKSKIIEGNEEKNYESFSINIRDYVEAIKKELNIFELPSLIKGVRGTSNEDHTPEYLGKAVLRAAHDIYVNKDGTTRYDMTEMAITHFKPKEIGTNIDKLKLLGYAKDIYDNDLVDDNQILEILPQDVILPSCEESSEDGNDIVFFKCANFIDDLLEKLYGQDKYYNLKSKRDLVGHLIISLAPHTSAGIIGRIIGFSNTQGCYAHPLWHSAQRRDCDGDENGIMLLMDGLLNFSRRFLPAHRGSTQDACLVLTTNLVPSEVDDMVFDMDMAWEYPLEFYKACEDNKMPWDIKIEQINENLGTEKQFEKYGFTHDTSNLNDGVNYSKYKSLPTMQEKVLGQMKLAEIIRAVDTSGVAALIIEKHFIRDIKGNLRKFSMQQFRCVECNTKYRRTPLLGKCLNCGGKLIFTISEGSVIKYLEPSLSLATKYNLPIYLQQTLELTKHRIESVFGKDPEKQENLGKWFG
jgi:DNA polymerase II large subunit